MADLNINFRRTNGPALSLTVPMTLKVEEVKSQLQEQDPSLEKARCRLVYKGKNLDDGMTLGELEVPTDATFFVLLTPARVLGKERNLALHQPTEQSSDYSPDFHSGRAVDGSGLSFTHTEFHTNTPSWWKVTLAGPALIKRVILHNRKDCCQSRLRDITIHLYKSGQEVWRSALLNPENVLSSPMTIEVTLPAESIGDELKVMREPDYDESGGCGNADETDVLSLSQVEVWGCQLRASGTTEIAESAVEQNVALHQRTEQSSEYSPDFHSGRAVDGVGCSFTHTVHNMNTPAWWSVWLDRPATVKRIVLHNRKDCAQSRLRDITVSVHKEGVEIWRSDLLNPENALYSPMQIEVATPVGMIGDQVKVTRTPDYDYSGGYGNEDETDVLSLSQVEVFGTPVST